MGEVFVTFGNMIELSAIWQVHNCQMSCIHFDSKWLVFVLHWCIIFSPSNERIKTNKNYEHRKGGNGNNHYNPMCLWNKVPSTQGIMNDFLSSPVLEKHKSQGGPFGTSRLSSASNSSTRKLLGKDSRQEANSAGRWGKCGQWPPIQVGMLNFIGKDS